MAYAIGGGVLALVAWVALRGVGGVAQDVAKGAVDATTGAVSGVAIGVGSTVGIPQTNKSKCQRDLIAHDYWSASFSCPASDFVKGIITG